MTKRRGKRKLKEKETKGQKIDGGIEGQSNPCKKKKYGYLYWGKSMGLHRFDPFFQGSGRDLSPPLDTVAVDDTVLDEESISSGCSFEVCGSKIYAFGGDFKSGDKWLKENGTKDITVLDLESNHAWSRLGVEIKSPRYRPLTAVEGTKIYILSTMTDTWGESPPDPWGEVFDTVLNTSTPLTHPPQTLIDASECHQLCQPFICNRILYISVSRANDMYSLDLDSGVWNLAYRMHPSSPVNPVPGRGTLVTDEGVLYAMWRGHLITHNIISPTEPQFVQGLDHLYKCWPALEYYVGHLLDLGDHKCCLLWTTPYYGAAHVLNVVTLATDDVTLDTYGYTPKIIAQAHYSIATLFPIFALVL